VTGTTFDNELFEPERGTQYEVGLKADWLDGRLSSTLAFSDLTRSNVLTTDPTNPNFSIQTGEQNSQGIELDVRGEILPGWSVIASYAYTDTRITEDNEFEVGNRLKGLGFGAGLFYVGQRQGNLENTFSLPSYLRTDAAVYYRRNNFRAALNFKNLFDIEYFETAQSDLRVFPGAPLTVEATVGWEF
jgi:iron complex outermembrane receptor protein